MARKAMPVIVLLSFFLCLTTQAAAQGTMPPPKILQIFREDVKPGKGAAHEKIEAGWPAAFAKAKWPTHYLAMTSTSGPSEAWFVNAWDSFAAIEKDTQNEEKNPALRAELDQLSQRDGEVLSGTRGMLALYREDLSYRQDINVAKMRYFRVITFRVRPGHETDFAEAVKTVRGAYEKLNADVRWATYQVSSGAPGGTFLVFIPMKSMAEIDEGLARSKALQEAEGEENEKKLQKIAREAYLGTESNIYAFSPKMSYVSKEFAAEDPDFWTPKPKAAPKAAAAGGAKEAAKPTTASKAGGAKPPKQP